MQLNTKGTNLVLVSELTSYLDKRMEAVEKLIPSGARVTGDIELAKPSGHHEKGPVFYAEINLHIDGTLYRAEGRAETIQAAIDEMQGNVLRELRRTKRKRLQFVREGGMKVKNFLRGFRGGGK